MTANQPTDLDTATGWTAALQRPSSVVAQLALITILGCLAGFVARAATSPDFDATLGADVKQASAEDVRAAVQQTSTSTGTGADESAPPADGAAPPVLKTIDFLTLRAELFGKPNVVLVDARDEGSFVNERIPGAVHLDAEAAEADPASADAALTGVEKTNVLVVYCSGGDCDLSLRLGRLLAGRGYSKVFVFEGGITEWQDQGEPLESGAVQ